MVPFRLANMISTIAASVASLSYNPVRSPSKEERVQSVYMQLLFFTVITPALIIVKKLTSKISIDSAMKRPITLARTNLQQTSDNYKKSLVVDVLDPNVLVNNNSHLTTLISVKCQH